jgi:hypothetical protein
MKNKIGSRSGTNNINIENSDNGSRSDMENSMARNVRGVSKDIRVTVNR